MPNSPLPKFAELRKIFSRQGVIQGSVPLAELPRMRELVVDTHGEAEATLGFVVDESGRRMISGRVCASVRLVCQRCLEPVDVYLTDELTLEVVTSESSSPQRPDQIETLLCPDMVLDVLDLVDEQLVLCLPIVPRHEEMACNGVQADVDKAQSANGAPATETGTRRGAFAVLEQLKRK